MSAVTSARVITERLGGSSLSARAADGEAPSDWYLPRPASPEEWARHMRAVAASVPAGWAAALAPAIAPTDAAADRLRRVAERGGVVITTGQQPGLFGGPVYTWSKAITALAIADALEETTGVPAAPLFWAATDDSDFAESSWTMVAMPGGAVELRIDGGASPGTSMAHVPIGDVGPLIERLERAGGSASWRAPLSAVRLAYRAGATVGSAYVELLRAMLAPLGVAVLDAAHPVARERASPVLRAALRASTPLADALAVRSKELSAAGYRPQVAEVGGLSLVFRVEDGQRRRIRSVDSAAVAEQASMDGLSANVLLRPVVERAILPTAAYVAGPAELSYFAQSGAVADALSLDRPLALPRWSGTILEPDVERILDRFDLSIDALRDPHAAETRLARASLPAGVAHTLAQMRAAIDASTAALAGDGTGLLPAAALTGARRSLEHRLSRLERRYTAAMKRRLGDELHQIATARGSLFPAGRRQERALNLIPFLARYGPDLLDRMREAAAVHAERLVGGRGAMWGSPRDAGHATPTPGP